MLVHRRFKIVYLEILIISILSAESFCINLRLPFTMLSGEESVPEKSHNTEPTLARAVK